MKLFRKLVPDLVRRYLANLRFPTLFVLTVLVFGVDVAVPDALPFADEILLALAGLILGRIRERDGPEASGSRGPSAAEDR